jgi:1-deoxy-D-xylulose-5-phosphate reductoisomerase
LPVSILSLATVPNVSDMRPDLPQILARRVTVLGATGTVGLATLDVIRHARKTYGADTFPLQALTAQKNVDSLAALALEFKPAQAVIGDPALLASLREKLAGSGIRVAAGLEALIEAAQAPSDLVMAAIVGAAGLAPTLAAVERGALITLANKECLVAAGPVFRTALKNARHKLIPVDSEHNAALQLLDGSDSSALEKVTLTASGGPFRTWTTERMAGVTPEQAVNHPNWAMGAKISVDSATLMNKGLELIEAHFLFDLPAERLDAVVHAQSVVHCLVSYTDGAQLAHLSAPDMRVPISYALGWPRRIASPARRLDLAQIGQLTFELPDMARFPCLRLARDCLQSGGAAPTILNAANEVAVEHFLGRRIAFLGIADVVERTLSAMVRETNGAAPASLAEVLALDAVTRARAQEICRAAA